jgi:hydrogenase expression/formation protein HypC
MCLAIPGKIVEIIDNPSIKMGKVDFGGVMRDVCLEAVPDAVIGNYVIVHAGFALNTLSEKEAQETLDLFKQLDILDSEMNPQENS